MALNNPLRDGQAQTSPTLFCAKKRLKQFGPDFRRNSFAFVRNDAQKTAAADCDADGEGPVLRHGLEGIQ